MAVAVVLERSEFDVLAAGEGERATRPVKRMCMHREHRPFLYGTGSCLDGAALHSEHYLFVGLGLSNVLMTST